MHGIPSDFVFLPSQHTVLVCKAHTGASWSSSVSSRDTQHGQVTAGDQRLHCVGAAPAVHTHAGGCPPTHPAVMPLANITAPTSREPGLRGSPTPSPWHPRCCQTIRAASLGSKTQTQRPTHPQLCRSPSARAEAEMHFKIIFHWRFTAFFPGQSHFAFTARAARALSGPCCNSQESTSVVEMVAKTTELSADVQLLQYTALTLLLSSTSHRTEKQTLPKKSGGFFPGTLAGGKVELNK